MARINLKKKITSNLGGFDNENSQFKMSDQHDMIWQRLETLLQLEITKLKVVIRPNRHKNKDWFSITKDDPKNYFLKHLQSQSNIPAFPIH